MRSIRSFLAAAAVAAFLVPAAARAQSDRALDITEAILDRFFTAHAKEKSERETVQPQVDDAEARLRKYEQCRRDFEAAGSASGSRLGGLAARVAIRAKCGTDDEEALRKQRQKVLDGPETAAAQAGGFALAEYRRLRDRIRGWLEGDASGFTTAGLAVLKARESQLRGAFGLTAVASGGGAGRGMRGPAVWNTDFAWLWISQLFAVQYLSGATMFESDYKPGDWTRWTVNVSDEDDGATRAVQDVEKAFLGRTADGGEWWRMKTVTRGDGGADTVTLEALFKPEGSDQYVQRLVRMRAKLPGSSEPQEMMVPEQWTTWNMRGAFTGRPTRESIDGATVGTERITTAAGSFSARHIRYGMGGGTLEWWLDETTTGGWVKFAALDEAKKPRYTMELAGKGNGARSELGITVP
ncbi:MAG: hypothetical protein K1X31_09680 [Gemmatimonadaceae bacterium]|nr:hypothetical protein [Gemmatimonadaceae bacterium]